MQTLVLKIILNYLQFRERYRKEKPRMKKTAAIYSIPLELCAGSREALSGEVQGYLAHKKKQPPRTQQYDFAQGAMAVLGRWAVSYERGTPVSDQAPLSRVWGIARIGFRAQSPCFQGVRDGPP